MSQDAVGHSATNAVTVTYPGATSAGNLLIAVAMHNDINNPTITGWTTLINGAVIGTADPMAILYKLANGTESSITANTTGSPTQFLLDIFEYSGTANPVATDGTPNYRNNNNTGNGTSYATPTITTANANDLIFSVFVTGSVSGVSWANSTLIGANTPGFQMYCGEYIVSSPQTNFSDTANWTGANFSATMIGAFQALPPPPSFVTPPMVMVAY